jgi:hypothetical protein
LTTTSSSSSWRWRSSWCSGALPDPGVKRHRVRVAGAAMAALAGALWRVDCFHHLLLPGPAGDYFPSFGSWRDRRHGRRRRGVFIAMSTRPGRRGPGADDRGARSVAAFVLTFPQQGKDSPAEAPGAQALRLRRGRPHRHVRRLTPLPVPSHREAASPPRPLPRPPRGGAGPGGDGCASRRPLHARRQHLHPARARSGSSPPRTSRRSSRRCPRSSAARRR